MHMEMIEFNTVILLWREFFRTTLLDLVDYQQARGGMPLHAVGVNCKKGANIKNQGAGAWYIG